MTNAQKIIKYIAIAFAVLLVFTIISAILTGGYFLINALGLLDKDKSVITEDLKTISSDITEVSSLNIDLAYTNLYIKTGEEFKVQTNNNNIKFENNNGSIKIEEKSKHWLSSENIEKDLIIYIKDNITLIDEINIDTGAGNMYIENLEIKGLYLNLGAGDVFIENVIVNNEVNISGGAGKTELKNCKLNNLKTDLGVGKFNFSGIITGKSKVNSGVGKINIYLTKELKDYTIDASKGLGSITINGENIEENKTYGVGKNYLELDGGIGEIKVDFIN